MFCQYVDRRGRDVSLDYIYMLVSVPSQFLVSEVMQHIKWKCDKKLQKEIFEPGGYGQGDILSERSDRYVQRRYNNI